MKSRKIAPFIFLALALVVLLWVSISELRAAKAHSDEQLTYLPQIEITEREKPGFLEAIPLSDGTLLVISSYRQQMVSYIYTDQNAQTPLEGWELYAPPQQILVVGCVWVVAQLDHDYFQVHKIDLGNVTSKVVVRPSASMDLYECCRWLFRAPVRVLRLCQGRSGFFRLPGSGNP